MRKIIISIFIIIIIVLGIILGRVFYDKASIVAQVNIYIPTLTEDSIHYTYFIYQKSKNEYTYKKVETKMRINQITSEKTVDSGSIKIKEQLDIIQKDIEENKVDFPIEGYSNMSIYYKNGKLNSLEELAERLF